MKLIRHLPFFPLILGATLSVELRAQTPANHPAKPGTATDISAAVGLNEIKLEMAESRFRLSKSVKAINDLVNALEDYLNSRCMGKLLQNLSYAGNPTDPTCLARMTRLLEIDPSNPVGLCVRDGISAKSCVDAYQNQKVAPAYSGSPMSDIDPAIKVGLSAETHERIDRVEQSLKEVNSKYQESTDPGEKQALINDAATLYDQALSMACKISTTSLTPVESATPTVESTEISQARERLLQIPAAIRRDYQIDMERKAVEELNKSSTSEDRKRELKELIKVINDPSVVPTPQLANLERTRIVLERCATLINMANQIVPDLPAVACNRDGWYTPKCVMALKKWRLLKQQEQAAAKRTPGAKVSPPSMISTF